MGVQIYSGWVGVGELVEKIVFAFVQILPQICNGPQTCLSVIKCLAKVAESIWIAAAAIIHLRLLESCCTFKIT